MANVELDPFFRAWNALFEKASKYNGAGLRKFGCESSELCYD